MLTKRVYSQGAIACAVVLFSASTSLGQFSWTRTSQTNTSGGNVTVFAQGNIALQGTP
jgi:hypothetical protein